MSIGHPLPELPLAGTTVLDATSNVAGPFGGAILGDLGAQVIKIENPAADAARAMSPIEGDRSAYFHVVNRNKSVVTIDLKSKKGRLSLSNLLDSADVLLTNFLPNKLAEYHLTPDELMMSRPWLIIGNLSSYGSEGPSQHFPGYDATVQARTGIMQVTGERSGGPVRTGISVLDVGSGTWLALGILAALIKRAKTGLGSVIETSLYETGVSWASYHLSAFQLTNATSFRSGSGHPAFAPYGLFKTFDGQIMLGVGSNVIFARLCTVINREDLIKNAKFKTNVDRVKNNVQLEAEIERVLVGENSSHWVELLAASGVPADHLAFPEDLLSDPQAAALNILVDYPDPSSKVKKMPGLPFRIDGKRPGIRCPAPRKDDGHKKSGTR